LLKKKTIQSFLLRKYFSRAFDSISDKVLLIWGNLFCYFLEIDSGTFSVFVFLLAITPP